MANEEIMIYIADLLIILTTKVLWFWCYGGEKELDTTMFLFLLKLC